MWNHKDSYRVRNGIVSASTIGHPSLGLVFFPAFDWKISATHPERQERLLYTRDQSWKKAYWMYRILENIILS